MGVWGAAALMLLPLFAMQITDKVKWDAADFAIFGAMLAVACGAYELAARRTGDTAYRAAVGIALAAAFILVSISLAVGIIGSEDHLANLMYGGVLAVGIAGSITVRFQPCGMAHVLFVVALAQALVAVIALIAGLGFTGLTWPGEILILTGIFSALWLISGWLFRKAGQTSKRQEKG
jgi:hypothetical protein